MRLIVCLFALLCAVPAWAEPVCSPAKLEDRACVQIQTFGSAMLGILRDPHLTREEKKRILIHAYREHFDGRRIPELISFAAGIRWKDVPEEDRGRIRELIGDFIVTHLILGRLHTALAGHAKVTFIANYWIATSGETVEVRSAIIRGTEHIELRWTLSFDGFRYRIVDISIPAIGGSMLLTYRREMRSLSGKPTFKSLMQSDGNPIKALIKTLEGLVRGTIRFGELRRRPNLGTAALCTHCTNAGRSVYSEIPFLKQHEKRRTRLISRLRARSLSLSHGVNFPYAPPRLAHRRRCLASQYAC